MKSNKEFMEEVKEAISLPAQTCRALAPESDEDISMYINDSSQNKNKETRNSASKQTEKTGSANTQNKDVLCEGGEK